MKTNSYAYNKTTPKPKVSLHLPLILMIVAAGLIVTHTWVSIIGNYNYENEIFQAWQLADKSSTLAAKSTYINEYVAKLKAEDNAGKFSSHNAVWLKTPNNSFASNMQALESLALRLNETKGMDPGSFQYNTAIQQITQQEQGEAWAINNTFQKCYNLENYPIIWGWIGCAFMFTGVGLLSSGIVLAIKRLVEK